MKAYYDGSIGTDERDEQWITLAGIAGTDAVWSEFDEKWGKMLRSRYPVAPYIHMSDLLGGRAPFESQAGWSECEKIKLIDDALVLLSQMDKSGFRMARVSIPETSRRVLENQGLSVPDPYLRCALHCVFFTTGIYALSPESERLYIFFDRGERFLGGFKNQYLSNRSAPGRARNPDNLWDYFADVQDVDQAYHFGLQVADMIAWSHSRAIGGRDRLFGNLSEWLERVVRSDRLDYSAPMLCITPEYLRAWEIAFRRDPNR